MLRRPASILLCLATVLVLRGDAQKREDGEPRALRPQLRGARAFDACATSQVRGIPAGLRIREVLADGGPISFEQEPAILTADYNGTIAFRNFLVAGDVGAVRFKSYNPEAPAEDVETWTRTGTRTVGGRLVSVFSPTWSADTLARILRRTNWGYDYPMLYWGEFLPEGVSPGQGFHVRVRMASTSLPDVSVNRLAADVQYSSHVVNIVLPGFGDSRLGADRNSIDFEAVTRKFYEHFQDSYDSIAVTTQDVHVSSSSAFHRNVKNAVNGIGENIFDDSARYGSAGRLRGVEMYYGSNLATNETSAHEMAHQWGSYYDWDRIMGLARAGHQPEAHDPLLAPSATLIGSVLDGTVHVERGAAAWQIAASDLIHFHPLTLYAMGILPRDGLPTLTVFNDQGQFGGDREPDAGTTVNGGTRDITVSHIAAVAGERSGPVDTAWHRAVVVVSRGALLSQREMNYWTFFAQRGEDPNNSAVPSYDGFVSFDEATNRAIDLKQDIRPKAASQIVQALPVDYPNFGPADWRGVVFDAPVASVYNPGQRTRLTGRVTATDRSDFSQILVRFTKHNGSADNAILARGAVGSNGSFAAEHEWQDAERGRYTMEVFLFWPGGPSQFPRSITTTIIVG